jgi:hypothetical protein
MKANKPILYINAEQTVRIVSEWTDWDARYTYILEKWIPPSRGWFWDNPGFWHDGRVGTGRWGSLSVRSTQNADKMMRWVEHYNLVKV